MSFTVLHNGRWRTPWASYLQEMLHAEGFLGGKEGPILEGPSEGVAVLPACWLTAEEQEALASFVAAGGTLLASRPPRQMAEVFGLKPTGRMAGEGYLRIPGDAAGLPLPGLEGLILQCPVAMDLYDLAGGEVLAWRCDPLEGSERYPAVVAHSFGRGLAVAFTWDLAEGVVRLQQGRPSQAAGQPESRPDGLDWSKPNDLFLGLLDARLRLVPQASVYHRLLGQLLENLAARQAQPLLRLWPFPRGVPALATFTGDSDGMDRSHFEQVLSIVERQGGRYTLYLMEEHRELLSPQEAAALRQAGHGLGHHTWVGMTPTLEEMRAGVRRQFEGFRERYGFQPLSHRGHCCIWVGWAEQAKILSENGVRLDSNHYPYTHHQYGFLSGSGRAFRYVDQQGTPLDLWEQPTLMSDDCMLQDKTGLPPFSVEEAIERSWELIDALVKCWHGVYHPCFHPVYMRTDWQFPYTAPWIEAVASHCREQQVPMLSAEEWASFLLARRSVRLLSLEPQAAGWKGVLQADQAVADLALLLPRGLTQVTLNGAPTPLQTRSLEGQERTLLICDLPAGVPVVLEGQTIL